MELKYPLDELHNVNFSCLLIVLNGIEMTQSKTEYELHSPFNRTKWN